MRANDAEKKSRQKYDNGTGKKRRRNEKFVSKRPKCDKRQPSVKEIEKLISKIDI